MFFQADDSSKKWKNEFGFFGLTVLKTNLFVRFLEESEDTKKPFEIIWPLDSPKKVKRERRKKNKEAIFDLRTIIFFAQCFVPFLFNSGYFFPSFPLGLIWEILYWFHLHSPPKRRKRLRRLQCQRLRHELQILQNTGNCLMILWRLITVFPHIVSALE